MTSDKALRLLTAAGREPTVEIDTVANWIRDVVPYQPEEEWTRRDGMSWRVQYNGPDRQNPDQINIEVRCPMGFIPTSTQGCPFAPRDFVDCELGPDVQEADVKSFAGWWDGLGSDQDTLDAALAYIWPEA